jgi:hypothetical protein
MLWTPEERVASVKEPEIAPKIENTEEAPGWYLPAILVGAILATFRFGGVWSWWALLWGPLAVLALACISYEWHLTVRSKWNMGDWEWWAFIATHLGAATALAVAFTR